MLPPLLQKTLCASSCIWWFSLLSLVVPNYGCATKLVDSEFVYRVNRTGGLLPSTFVTFITKDGRVGSKEQVSTSSVIDFVQFDQRVRSVGNQKSPISSGAADLWVYEIYRHEGTAPVAVLTDDEDAATDRGQLVKELERVFSKVTEMRFDARKRGK